MRNLVITLVLVLSVCVGCGGGAPGSPTPPVTSPPAPPPSGGSTDLKIPTETVWLTNPDGSNTKLWVKVLSSSITPGALISPIGTCNLSTMANCVRITLEIGMDRTTYKNAAQDVQFGWGKNDGTITMSLGSLAVFSEQSVISDTGIRQMPSPAPKYLVVTGSYPGIAPDSAGNGKALFNFDFR